jgi:hypothetical protein
MEPLRLSRQPMTFLLTYGFFPYVEKISADIRPPAVPSILFYFYFIRLFYSLLGR